MSRPAFHNVLDLGLRDVGVVNQPRRHAAHLGRWSVPVVVIACVLAVGSCVVVSSLGRGPIASAVVAVLWPAIALALALRMVRRAPVVVVRASADGRGLLGGRARAAVRALRSALAPDETVLGDGAGVARGAARREALRIVAATDRRLLVADQERVLLDVPYAYVRGFGIAWQYHGHLGTLTVDVGGTEHVIGSIAPANLLSIAQALRAHGVPTGDGDSVDLAQRGWDRALRRGRHARRAPRLAVVAVALIVGLAVTASAAGLELAALPAAFQEATADTLPVDGRSDLSGGAASFTYSPGPGLKELRTDEDWGEGPNDGARWELRSSFTKGYNVVSLAHYVFVPRLDDPAAVAAFVADKDGEHASLAGRPVPHTERVVDGRKGFVWEHRDRRGYWHFAAWFPQPVHSVRLECIARREAERFERLCAEAMGSLRFHR